MDRRVTLFTFFISSFLWAKASVAVSYTHLDVYKRQSHENPYIQQLYSEYLGEPCGPKAHKLLHTHYIDRKEVIGMYIETEKSK